MLHDKIIFQQMLKEVFIMKPTGHEISDKAEKALRTCLERVPFLKIDAILREPAAADVTPDFLVKLTFPGGKQHLLVEVKSSGQPRIARQAINQLLRYLEKYPASYGVFVAPYISPQAADICVQDGIGYMDLAGNCYLCFGQVYIRQEGKPNSFATKRDLRSLYSPKATRVLRVLLTNGQKAWKLQELAKEAGVSLGQASNVKKLLSDREWIRTDPDGFILDKPEALLEEWAENYTYRKNQVRDFYSLKSLTDIEADLANICRAKGVNYALTGFSGAARFAPTVRYQRVTAYVEDMTEDLISLVNLKEVSSGANVSLLTPYDAGVFYGAREFEDIRIASPIQIYLDLLGVRGRGEEAASALLEKVIRPTW
jgi:Transcriptional regulator, AbiEi antitoxin, Type IV TA system